MDHDALQSFVHLAGTLHFGRTSRERHISPSALSRLVQRLEHEVGWPLFERDQRTVKLTTEGRRFVAYARNSLQAWDVYRSVGPGSQAGLSGSISIFASVTACQSFLPRVLATFRKAYPDIRIGLQTGYAADALERLATGAVDVAVAALPDRVPASLAVRVLLHTPLVFVAPVAPCEVARQVAHDPIAWADVPIVLPATGLARVMADRWFRRKHVTPHIYSEVPGSEAILSLVNLGCGVGIVPELVRDRSPLRHECRRLSVAPAIGEFRIGVCVPHRRLTSPLVKAFWDSLADKSKKA